MDKSEAGEFGRYDGDEVANKDAVLGELDRLLNKGEPPDLELIFILPFPNRTLLGKPVAYTNPFGHIALRYRLAPSQETVVVNVIGFESPQMVNFVKPEDFFFGTHGWHVGNEQGGVYNRNFVSLRIERVAAWQLQELHTFFLDLHMRWKEGQVHYVFGLDGKLRNLLSQQFKCGNCSDWIGYALQKVGLVDEISMLPLTRLVAQRTHQKTLWIRVYEWFLKAELNVPFRNMHVVNYNRIPHIQSYGADGDVSGWSNVLHFHDRQTYSHLTDLAEVEVYLPKGEKHLAVRRLDVSTVAPHVRDKFEHPSAEFTLPRVGMKWSVACTDSWRVISEMDTVELRQIVRSPSGMAWALDSKHLLHMWDGEEWRQLSLCAEALTLEENGGVVVPVMVTVDKKDGRPFMLAQDRRTVFELEVDCTRNMDIDAVDPNNKGKRRMHGKTDDRVPIVCRHVVDSPKSMPPIADVALATGQDLYAVTTDGRLHRYSKWMGWETDVVNDAHLRSISVDADGALYAITNQGRILWRTEWLQKWHSFSHGWNATQLSIWNRLTAWALDDQSRAYVLNPITCEWSALGNCVEKWPISGLASTGDDEPWALVSHQAGSTAVLSITRHRLEFMAADATHELAKIKSRSAKGRQMRFYRAEPLKRVPSNEFLEQTHLESQVKHDKKKRRVQRQEEKERMQAELERGEDSPPSGFIARLGEKLGTLFKRDERSRRERHQHQLIKEELEMPKPVRAGEDREQGQARDGLDPEVTKTKTNMWANLEAELQAKDEQAVWHRLGDVADNAAYRQPIYPALLVREVPPLQRDEYVQALVPPKSFALVFSSLAVAGRHADAPGVSVWRPVPPTPDYAAVGHVVTSGKSPATAEADEGYPYGCLHKSFLAPAGKVSDAHLRLWQPEWMSEGKLHVSHVSGEHAGKTLVCPSLFTASEERESGEEVFLPPLPVEPAAVPPVSLLLAPRSPSSPSTAHVA